ncbi:MAG: methyltransferase domain-containing protein [Actinomycetaceae bacterium]|nr:methyltransferase domain-containing protein [Actinomycetaceae bacterium]
MTSPAFSSLNCAYFEAQVCHSCPEINVPYAQQVETKTQAVKLLLPEIPASAWLPTQQSPQFGFRNKAKMVVSGTAARPQLGILDRDFAGQDLSDCPLYSARLRALFPVLKSWISRLGISPYRVAEKTGELKYLLVTENPAGQFMVRWVLRSHRHVNKLRAFTAQMRREVPQVVMMSVNILPQHVALTEGEEELPLFGDYLEFALGKTRIQLQPRSFFQTNTLIAHAMYQQAQRWATVLQPQRAVDLFCGVGGFALFLAPVCRQVTGVEISAPAIEAAKRGALASGLENVDFYAADATSFSLSEGGLQLSAKDLVLVNPPRRGIGVELAQWLNTGAQKAVIYSSCNPVSLAKDLKALTNFKPLRARVFDMFPGTAHTEVMVLLVRD